MLSVLPWLPICMFFSVQIQVQTFTDTQKLLTVAMEKGACTFYQSIACSNILLIKVTYSVCSFPKKEQQLRWYALLSSPTRFCFVFFFFGRTSIAAACSIKVAISFLNFGMNKRLRRLGLTSPSIRYHGSYEYDCVRLRNQAQQSKSK